MSNEAKTFFLIFLVLFIILIVYHGEKYKDIFKQEENVSVKNIYLSDKDYSGWELEYLQSENSYIVKHNDNYIQFIYNGDDMRTPVIQKDATRFPSREEARKIIDRWIPEKTKRVPVK
jgi:hypothetical protein